MRNEKACEHHLQHDEEQNRIQSIESSNGTKSRDIMVVIGKTVITSPLVEFKITTQGTGKGQTDDRIIHQFDEAENFIGKRTQSEIDDLAHDPAHAGSTRQIDIEKGKHEARVGLELEEMKKLDGPITRDPSGIYRCKRASLGCQVL